MLLGLTIGHVFSRLLGETTAVKTFRGGLLSTMLFGNSMGFALALLPTILDSTDQFGPGAKKTAALYTTMYGTVNLLAIWTGAHLFFSGQNLGREEEDASKLPTVTSAVRQAVVDPTFLATVLGLTIGLFPSVRSNFYGGHLTFVMAGLQQLGQACFPVMTLMLGCTLAKGVRSEAMDITSCAGFVFARLVVRPLAGLYLHRFMITQGLLPDDKLMQFCILLQACVPSGTQLALVAAGSVERVKAISALLLPQYALAAVSMTFWIAVFLAEVSTAPLEVLEKFHGLNASSDFAALVCNTTDLSVECTRNSTYLW
jgi:predicted permease